jgi:hypothetical protein
VSTPTTLIRHLWFAGLALAVALSAGCAPTPPAIVPVEGVVYLDGQPLPMARVEFVPELKHFGAEYSSSAVTDENGHFVLVCALGQQPGAAVATHRVMVTEHTPDDMRGMSGQAQAKLADYQAKLKNRPIPDDYGNFSKTPLSIDVRAAGTYDVKLTRKP